MAGDTELSKWAISVLSSMPTMQSLVAVLVILALALPLLRAGWKEFKGRSAGPEHAPSVPAMEPWLVSTLTKIEMELQLIREETRDLMPALVDLKAGLAAGRAELAKVDHILRLRTKKARTKPGP